MERNTKLNKKRQLVIFLVGVFLFQIFIVALFFMNTNIITTNNLVDNDDDTKYEEEIIISEGIIPNLTRTDYPLILNNDSAEALWTS